MSFPTDPLDVRLVFAFGATLTAAPTSWTWTDCTSDLRTTSDQSVEIKVGRSDRAKQPEPNQATFALNNFAGQYTVDNPAGQFFPNIVENVPGIVAAGRNPNPTFEVDASDWAATNGAVTRSTVRAKIGAASGLLTPTGGFATASANIVAKVPVRPSGAVYVDAWVYSVAGWAQTAVAVNWYDGSNVFISTSVGPNVAVAAGVWTYLGAYIGPAPTNAAGAVGRVLMSGTPANTDLLWIDEARTSIPELCGYVDGWTPQFDDSGNLATCAVSMSGARRRLGRGTPPLRSPMYRAAIAAQPSAYVPLEEASNATQAGSGLSGGPTYPATGVVKFGASIKPAGSAAAVDFTGGGKLSGPTGLTAGPVANWELELAIAFAPFPTGNPVGNRYTVATVQCPGSNVPTLGITLINDIGTPTTYNLGLIWYTPTAHGADYSAVPPGPMVAGQTYHFRIRVAQSGGNIAWTLFQDGVLVETSAGITGTLYQPTWIALNEALAPADPPANPASLSHAAIWSPARTTPTTYLAATGYAGDTAADRMTRLCGEEPVPIAAIANPAKSMPMGAQSVATFLDLLLECENADGGLFSEPFDGFGFGYIVRSDLYNLPVAVTIDRAGGQLAPPFAPLHDDLQRQNDVTVTRKGGSSARYIGDTSRGTYVDAPTLNVAVDSVLLNIAAWRVHIASPRGRLRHPSLGVNFANVQAAPLGPIFGATRGVGIRVQVINPPSQVPQGVDILVSGYTKKLAYKAWSVSLLGTPYEVWRVFTIGDPVLGRLDSGASSLTGGPYSAGAVSLSVATSTGPLWITTAGQPTKFPFDADIAGQRVTVTGISGVASPQTFTVNATPAALANGAPVRLWRPACLAL